MRKVSLIICFLFFPMSLKAENLTLLLDWFINPDHGPIIIAEKNGFFSDYDLEVDIIAPADPSAPPKLVAAGKGDIAISYQPQLHLNVKEGLPLTRVGTLIATPLNCLLTLKDGEINKISDLKGKKVGFSVSGVEEALLEALLKKNKLELKDISLINVNFSLSPSLMTKQVDAVIGAYRNFELNQMEIENVPGKCFYLEEEGIPSYDELIYVANKKDLKIKKIRKFLLAIEKATQFIVNNPNKSWEIFSSYSPELNDELNKKAWYDTYARFSLTPSAIDTGRYVRFEKFLLEYGLIDKGTPVDNYTIDVFRK